MTTTAAAPPQLNGRRIIVTGCSSGIGAATSAELARRGAHVIGVDIRQPDALIEEFIQCDLADPRAIESAVGSIPDPLHGLCNVAGLAGEKGAEGVIRVNLLALREMTEAVLPRLETGGCIVNVVSTAGSAWHQRLEEHLDLLRTADYDELLARLLEKGMSGPEAYDFTKETAVVYTMLRARARYREAGIRVNAVSPGPVATPLLSVFYTTMDRELLEAFEDVAGKAATPEDLALSVILLFSSDACWINGANLIADGGADAAWLTEGLATSAKMW